MSNFLKGAHIVIFYISGSTCLSCISFLVPISSTRTLKNISGPDSGPRQSDMIGAKIKEALVSA